MGNTHSFSSAGRLKTYKALLEEKRVWLTVYNLSKVHNLSPTTVRRHVKDLKAVDKDFISFRSLMDGGREIKPFSLNPKGRKFIEGKIKACEYLFETRLTEDENYLETTTAEIRLNSTRELEYLRDSLRRYREIISRGEKV